MNDYLIQTKYAASSLIDLIRTEEIALRDFLSSLSSFKRIHQILYNDFRRKEFDPDDHFDDFQVMHAFARQAQAREQVDSLENKIETLKMSISSKEESIKTLSGALLQIAKQGISTVHNGLRNCPSGRMVNNEPLKNVIWQGRNQSMHYEEPFRRSEHRHVIDCFSRLNIPLENINLAKEIIDLLEWKTYEQYENDLISLLG
ncbi:hypothetical protein [Lysinibacillus sp. NPDC093688]|uniref:hypothetical protein n=1 Tax=Lysinibacillus sp. NPDC093688 TaxID=3390577 RepID=UPI003D079C4E